MRVGYAPVPADDVARVMSLLRRFVVSMTLATLVLHVAAVGLGAFRGCSEREHTHAGAAAKDCPMHHLADVQPTHAAHAGHGNAGAEPTDDRDQVRCGCFGTATSPYVGPACILVSATSLLRVMPTEPVTPGADESAASLRFPPPPPPPR